MAYNNWLSRSTRTGGEYNTGNAVVPADIDEIRIKLDVVNADFATPDKSITAEIQVSDDGATNWKTVMTVGWVGGPPPVMRNGQVGWFAIVSDVSRFVGMLARVHVSVSGNFPWGVQGDILKAK